MKLSLVELATVTPGTDKPQALEEALAAARQAEDLGHRSILAVNAVVADTDAEAQRLSWSMRATLARLAGAGAAPDVPTVDVAARELTQAEKDTPTVIADGLWPRLLAGSPITIRDQIEQMTKATGVQEIMVQDVVADPEARAYSRALLAQALGVTPDGAAAP
jgi:alkanesulfonate monooxygenase SsuD/methylene tetrahydromethanopterin reductase-like flavin-dependent oxidoreductase (luciferase family)